MPLVSLGEFSQPAGEIDLSCHVSRHEFAGNNRAEHGLNGQDGPVVVRADPLLHQIASTQGTRCFGHFGQNLGLVAVWSDMEVVLVDKERTHAVILEEQITLVIHRHPLLLLRRKHFPYDFERSLK